MLSRRSFLLAPLAALLLTACRMAGCGGGEPPLFGHQYLHVWIDFRDIQDAYMRERGIDQGPILATIENHRTGMVWELMRQSPSIVHPHSPTHNSTSDLNP